MNELTRSTKLVVIVDQSGSIRSAMWPGIHTEGAPTQTGIDVPAGQVAHEVEVPRELYEAARPDLSNYILQIANGRAPTLVRRAPQKEAK
jgi:hypothetical protein